MTIFAMFVFQPNRCLLKFRDPSSDQGYLSQVLDGILRFAVSEW